MFRSYHEVRDWLESYIPQVYGKEELGLARITELLNRLGNPQNKFKSIHVAGTSGKGSTAFYIARLLVILGSPSTPFRVNSATPESSLFVDSGQSQNDKKGLKVGLHVSPHLVDIRERMQIFGEVIPRGKFIRVIGEVREIVEQIEKEKRELTPSYFEILVAASFLYFAQEKVDWAVVEVGLGGRLDATNVLIPEVSVITNIGLDHTEILGNTVEKIAWEKAGIIKPGMPVVTGAKGKGLGVIRKVATEKKASLFVVDRRSSIDYSPKYCTKETAALAVAAVEVTLGYSSNFIVSSFPPASTSRRRGERKRESRSQPMTGSPIGPQRSEDRMALYIKSGMTGSRPLSTNVIERTFSVGFPGRFEEIMPGVILDGAHNPDKVRALIQFINHRHSGKRSASRVDSGRARMTGVMVVVAFKKGKDWKTMIDVLLKNLPVEQVIATEFQAVTDTGKFAAVPAEEIKEFIISNFQFPIENFSTENPNVKVINNSQEAVFEAFRLRPGSTMLVLVTGSLYLVGEVRTMWDTG